MRFTYMKDTEEQLLYYQFPKFLLEIPLSQNARIVYSLLYDRARISRKNQWVDEQGEYMVYFLSRSYLKSWKVSDVGEEGTARIGESRSVVPEVWRIFPTKAFVHFSAGR